MGASRAIRSGRRADAARRSTSSASRRTLDCSPTGPIASPRVKFRRAPQPAAGTRAQHRDHRVGLGRSQVVSARRRVHRPPQSDAQRQRPALRLARVELSDYLPVLDPVHNTVSRVPLTVRDPSTQPATGPTDGRAVRLLGRRSALDEQEQRPQSDDRREGTRVDHVDHSSAGQSGVLQSGIDASVGQALPGESLRAPARDVRPEDEEADAHQHVLRHAPSDVRRGRESHAVDERRRRGRRLARHEDVRRDGRRREVAGLDGAHPRHERQRQARRIHGAEPAGRSDEGSIASTPASTPWRPRPTARSGVRRSAIPGGIVRLVPGAHPPETALAEYYEPPYNNPNVPVRGFSPRGMDIDRNGVAWIALASGHMASFDRRKCKGPLNGPTATGQHCPEGWTLYAEPLPQLKGVTDRGSAEASYYTWVDQFDALGLGQEHADQHRQRVRGVARAQGRPVGDHARAVSARLLHEVDGRPHRRRERRMEGSRALGDGEHARAVPYGNWKGHDEQGDALPVAAESAGAVIRL